MKIIDKISSLFHKSNPKNICKGGQNHCWHLFKQQVFREDCRHSPQKYREKYFYKCCKCDKRNSNLLL